MAKQDPNDKVTVNGKEMTWAEFEKDYNENYYPAVRKSLQDKPIEVMLESMFDILTAEFGKQETFYFLLERLSVRLDAKMSDELIKKLEDYYNSEGFYEYFRKTKND